MLPKLMTLKELLAENNRPVKYVVDGFLPVAGLSLLSAIPKSGKSTLIRELMYDVAQGLPFFGRPTTKVRILYYALEEPIAHVSDEFRQMGLTDADLVCRVGSISPRFQVMELLRNDIEEYNVGLAIIDPLFDAVDTNNANEYGVMNDAMKAILRIARTTGSHIMVVHHASKAERTGGNSVLGSQAIAGATDHNAFLTVRANGDRLFMSQARVGYDFPLSRLAFDHITRRMWIAGTLKEDKLKAMADTLLEVLADNEWSVVEWRSRVAGRNQTKAEAMKALEEEGLIESRIVGKSTLWRKCDPGSGLGAGANHPEDVSSVCAATVG